MSWPGLSARTTWRCKKHVGASSGHAPAIQAVKFGIYCLHSCCCPQSISLALLLQIKEEYPLSGEVKRYKRRDLRKGVHLQLRYHL